MALLLTESRLHPYTCFLNIRDSLPYLHCPSQDLFSNHGSNSCPLQWETTGLPGKSFRSFRLFFSLFFSVRFFFFFNCEPSFKVLIELVAIFFLFSVLVLWLEDIWDLSSPTRDVIGTPAFGRQSLSHGTSKDVPGASGLTQDGKEVVFGHFFAH